MKKQDLPQKAEEHCSVLCLMWSKACTTNYAMWYSTIIIIILFGGGKTMQNSTPDTRHVIVQILYFLLGGKNHVFGHIHIIAH